MAKPELGQKRQCQHCGAKFYDLNRDPIICPKCSGIFEIIMARPEPSSDEDIEAGVGGPEMVSLDDVAAAEVGDDSLDDAMDIDVDTGVDDDDTFLEDEEEGDEDVTGFIDSSLKDDDET